MNPGLSVDRLSILKFGSSVLRSDGDLPVAVREISRERDRGHRVIAVVSALGQTTNALLSRAESVSAEPDPDALAALLSTGEIVAAALLALALDRTGVPATVLDPRAIGLEAGGPLLDAHPVGLDTAAVRRALVSRDVAVVPGFFGTTPTGRIAVFGRGGSDLTALYLAHHLGAETCRLLKDVDGVYERDPIDPQSVPARFDELHYTDALRLGARVVQEKALRFAADHGVSFQVAAPGREWATRIGSSSSRFPSAL